MSRRVIGLAVGFVVGLVLTAAACKRPEERAAPPPDAAVAPRPRPPEVAHLTLKVLGMT